MHLCWRSWFSWLCRKKKNRFCWFFYFLLFLREKQKSQERSCVCSSTFLVLLCSGSFSPPPQKQAVPACKDADRSCFSSRSQEAWDGNACCCFLIGRSKSSSWKHLGKSILCICKKSWAKHPVPGKRAEAAVLGMASGDFWAYGSSSSGTGFSAFLQDAPYFFSSFALESGCMV